MSPSRWPVWLSTFCRETLWEEQFFKHATCHPTTQFEDFNHVNADATDETKIVKTKFALGFCQGQLRFCLLVRIGPKEHFVQKTIKYAGTFLKNVKHIRCYCSWWMLTLAVIEYKTGQAGCVWHPVCNLKGFLFVIVALQVARKIASCNVAIRRLTAVFPRLSSPRKDCLPHVSISRACKNDASNIKK